MRHSGFTIIELLVVTIFLLTAGIVSIFQLQKINNQHDDEIKKTAINSIYYSLEEEFYTSQRYYPEHIKDDTLKTIDSKILTDPDGYKIGEKESSYRYEPKKCQEGKCESYTLRASLSEEEDFVKKNRNH